MSFSSLGCVTLQEDREPEQLRALKPTRKLLEDHREAAWVAVGTGRSWSLIVEGDKILGFV
jgi:hypothetical protein